MRGFATKNNSIGLKPHLDNRPLPAFSTTLALGALVSRKSRWKESLGLQNIYVQRPGF